MSPMTARIAITIAIPDMTARRLDFDDFDDEFERRVDFGASLGWMGAGIIGWEVDFGYSPNFFENTVGPADFEFGDSNVTTLMANVLFSAPPSI